MAKAKGPPPPRRIRRRPEDARRLILDAAEATMGAEGPAALRLQDVAREAGVSHPTILHHFGSREGLVAALNARAVEALKSVVVTHMGPGGEGVRATFAAYRDGLAQRILWLAQSGAPASPDSSASSEEIVAALQAERVKHAQPGTVPDIEETRAVVHLTAVAAFGDALIGARMRENKPGAKGDAGADGFATWFAEMIKTYLRAKI